MSVGLWLALCLIVPACGLAAWMWLVVARFNLEHLSLYEVPGLTLED